MICTGTKVLRTVECVSSFVWDWFTAVWYSWNLSFHSFQHFCSITTVSNLPSLKPDCKSCVMYVELLAKLHLLQSFPLNPDNDWINVIVRFCSMQLLKNLSSVHQVNKVNVSGVFFRDLYDRCYLNVIHNFKLFSVNLHCD